MNEEIETIETEENKFDLSEHDRSDLENLADAFMEIFGLKRVKDDK